MEQLLIAVVDSLALSLRNQGLMQKARELELAFDRYFGIPDEIPQDPLFEVDA